MINMITYDLSMMNKPSNSVKDWARKIISKVRKALSPPSPFTIPDYMNSDNSEYEDPLKGQCACLLLTPPCQQLLRPGRL